MERVVDRVSDELVFNYRSEVLLGQMREIHSIEWFKFLGIIDKLSILKVSKPFLNFSFGPLGNFLLCRVERNSTHTPTAVAAQQQKQASVILSVCRNTSSPSISQPPPRLPTFQAFQWSRRSVLCRCSSNNSSRRRGRSRCILAGRGQTTNGRLMLWRG